MTEVPEHLLKRSKERRAAIEGGGDADAPSDAASESSAPVPAESEAPAAPAPAAAAAVEPEEAAPPPPPPPYVQAAMRRRRIPYWVMPVLAFLPIWAYLYQGTLEPPQQGEGDPLVVGGELYASNCASCHGGGGGGGVGPAFTDGAIYATWPEWENHFRWVRLGDAGWPEATYGAQDTPVGSGMPGFGDLSDAELILVVNYERNLGGEPPEEGIDLALEALARAAALDPEADFATLLEEAQPFFDELGADPGDVTFEGEGSPESAEG